MRLLHKVLIVIFAIFAVMFIAAHVYVNLKGRELLTRKLTDVFKREVKVGTVYSSLPFNIYARNIEVKDLFTIDKIYGGAAFFDLVNKSLDFSTLKIYNPKVTLVRSIVKPTEPIAPAPAPALSETAAPGDKVFNKALLAEASKDIVFKPTLASPGFFARRVRILGGEFTFVDKNTGTDKNITIRANKINVNIENFNLTAAGFPIISFLLNGKIPWTQGKEEGSVAFQGWVNLVKKDIQATLRVRDIDGLYLYPYYATWVNLEKSRIERARLDFTSVIHGLNNEVSADCRLELSDIAFKPRAPEEQKERGEKLAEIVLDMFKSMGQGNISLDFTVKTKLDSPVFCFSDIKMAIENKLSKAREGTGITPEGVAQVPGKIIGGTVKSFSDITKAVIAGSVGIGKELTSAIGGAFKKEGEPQPQAPEPPANVQEAPQVEPEPQPLPQAPAKSIEVPVWPQPPAQQQAAPETASQPAQEQQPPVQQPASK